MKWNNVELCCQLIQCSWIFALELQLLTVVQQQLRTMPQVFSNSDGCTKMRFCVDSFPIVRVENVTGDLFLTVMSPCLENSFKMQEIMSAMKYWIEHFPHVRISFQEPVLHSEIRWSLYRRESLLYILCLSEKTPRPESSSTDATWYSVQTKKELHLRDAQFRVSSREIRNFPSLSTEYLNEYVHQCLYITLLSYKLQRKPHHKWSLSKRLICSSRPKETNKQTKSNLHSDVRICHVCLECLHCLLVFIMSTFKNSSVIKLRGQKRH